MHAYSKIGRTKDIDLNKVSGWQKMIFEFPEHVELAVSPFDYVVYVFIPFKI